MADRRLFLVKVGEILLKLGNRKEFEERLRNDLKNRLRGLGGTVEYFPGRFFIWVPEERAAEAETVLARTPGVNGFAKAEKTEKTLDAVAERAVSLARRRFAEGKTSFKVESRRSDKSFPLDSFALSRELGSRILDAIPGLRVDVHTPAFTVFVEIRERAYVYTDPDRGLRGLPVGSQGKGLLLLSGGIDSPVAGCLMAARGLNLDALYFHAYPYTSQEAYEKVVSLARIIAGYTGGITLWTVPFTEVQIAIKKGSREDATTLMLRAAMMEVADRLARRIGAGCLVTGESLGQVASQTQENMRFTEHRSDLPVFRPLIGMDKEDTIKLAKEIGSYETSILPYEDCCVIFSPEHPLLKADFARERAAYEALELGPLLEEALKTAEKRRLPYPYLGAD